eukprot:GEMP01071030.1.p1 GENE.GEMP01071030.1~~GEMP01071030.1.p1  ORF type:complete len:112 (-),score=1.98 GEMP01071030.1:153-488(-)
MTKKRTYKDNTNRRTTKTNQYKNMAGGGFCAPVPPAKFASIKKIKVPLIHAFTPEVILSNKNNNKEVWYGFVRFDGIDKNYRFQRPYYFTHIPSPPFEVCVFFLFHSMESW